MPSPCCTNEGVKSTSTSIPVSPTQERIQTFNFQEIEQVVHLNPRLGCISPLVIDLLKHQNRRVNGQKVSKVQDLFSSEQIKVSEASII